MVFEGADGRYLPLYEGKFTHHFDSRFATYENATQAQINKGTLPRFDTEAHQDPAKLPLPRHWVAEEHVDDRLAADLKKQRQEWRHNWLLGWRDVCRASDERTVIPSVLPRTAVGHTAPLMQPKSLEAPLFALIANLSSYVLDFAARQKVQGAHLTYTYLEQLPVLAPDAYDRSAQWINGESAAPWIRPRVLELTYSAYEMSPWAEYLGDDGAPFIWDEDRRFLIRAELDAAFFHLYGIKRADVDLVLDSFRAFRNKKPELFQQTKDEIIRVYEAMAEGKPFTHPALTPPPGQGPRHAPGTSPLTRKTPPPGPKRPPQPRSTGKKKSGGGQLGGGLFNLAEIDAEVQLDLFDE